MTIEITNVPAYQLTISGNGTDVLVENVSTQLVTLVTQGPQGIPGEQGIPGTGGDLNYVHTQSIALAVWDVTHNLGKYPATTVVDSAGTIVQGDVQYPSANRAVLTFSGEFSGFATFN